MTSALNNKRTAERSDGKRMIKKVAAAAGIGAVLFMCLMFLVSFICLRMDTFGWILPAAAYLCCVLSAFPCGCIASRSVGKSGMLCGLLSSIPLCVLLLILCLALYGSVASGYWIAVGLSLSFGALGGIAALNIRRKRRYR